MQDTMHTNRTKRTWVMCFLKEYDKALNTSKTSYYTSRYTQKKKYIYIYLFFFKFSLDWGMLTLCWCITLFFCYYYYFFFLRVKKANTESRGNKLLLAEIPLLGTQDFWMTSNLSYSKVGIHSVVWQNYN